MCHVNHWQHPTCPMPGGYKKNLQWLIYPIVASMSRSVIITWCNIVTMTWHCNTISLCHVTIDNPGPLGLPCYVEELALVFANEFFDSSLPYSSPPRHYDSRVLSYLDLSASKSKDSWIVMYWYSFFHYHWFSLKLLSRILDFYTTWYYFHPIPYFKLFLSSFT